MTRRARLLLNPGAGRGRGRRRAVALAALAARHGLELVESRDPGHLTELARQAAVDGVERLLVAGGDGTLHLAIQGLVGSTTALAPVPLGSGNDLALALGTARSLPMAVTEALEGPLGTIDLARAEVGEEVRHYSCVASLGFDSAVNAVANRIRHVSGPAIYVYAVLRTLVSFRAPWLELEWDGGRFEGPAMFAVTANGPSYGGGMRIAPAASLVDGLLDLVWVRSIPRRTLLAVFPKVFSGRHIGHSAVAAAQSRTVRLRSIPGGMLYADGELVGRVDSESAVIAAAPRALVVVSGSQGFSATP